MIKSIRAWVPNTRKRPFLILFSSGTETTEDGPAPEAGEVDRPPLDPQRAVDVYHQPDLETFLTEIKNIKPAILTGVVDHWPAVTTSKWSLVTNPLLSVKLSLKNSKNEDMKRNGGRIETVRLRYRQVVVEEFCAFFGRVPY